MVTRDRLRAALPWLPLAVTLLLTVVLYAPALNSPFFADDYVYIEAVRNNSFPHYLRVILDPTPHPDVLVLTQNYWRPLFYLSFEGSYRLFGGHVLPYHLVNLGSHLAATVLVWAIARRLTRRWEAAGVAAFVFALHPADAEAVSWISSVNHVALPLALGGWLMFMRAVEAKTVASRRRQHAFALLLLAIALGFRETSAVAFAAIGIWYLLVHARPRLRDPRAYLPLVPYIALAAIYVVLNTKFFTLGLSKNVYAYEWGSQVPRNALTLLRMGVGGVSESTTGWHRLVSGLLTAVLLLGLPAALLARRWVLASVIAIFVVSVLPTAGVTFGLGVRYFYLSSAFFALAIGVGAAEVWGLLMRLGRPRLVGSLSAAVFLIGAAYGLRALHQNLANWIDANPDASQRWVEQLNQRVGRVPAGGTVYAANPPIILGLFGGYSLKPTLRYYQPQVRDVILVQPGDLDAVRKAMGPDDRLFDYAATR